MPVGSTGVVPLGTLSGAPHQALAVSPSAAYGKVGIVVSNNRTAPFRTDAVWAAGTSVVLPIGSVDRIIPD
jgi:hypothetical protein